MRDEATAVAPQPEEGRRSLVQRIMRQQASLSVRVAGVFIALLILLPLLNLFNPGLAATPVGGFTLAWFILGIAFFPFMWLLASYFVKRSDDLESAIVVSERRPSEPEDGAVA